MPPSHDPNIFDEPHMRGTPHQADPSEARADRNLEADRRRDQALDRQIEHSVWDEPGIAPELAGDVPADQMTYAEWLDFRRSQTPLAHTWLVTLGIALAAGPFAIIGAFYGSGQTTFSIIAICVFAPIVEEVMKTAAAMYVVEKKPFFFRSSVQILICALAGGLAFATIENLLYLHVYIPNPSQRIIVWRWTICTAMHTTCTFITGIGMVRIWRDTWTRHARPRLTFAFPFLLTAIIIHGGYNAFAVLYHFIGDGFRESPDELGAIARSIWRVIG